MVFSTTKHTKNILGKGQSGQSHSPDPSPIREGVSDLVISPPHAPLPRRLQHLDPSHSKILGTPLVRCSKRVNTVCGQTRRSLGLQDVKLQPSHLPHVVRTVWTNPVSFYPVMSRILNLPSLPGTPACFMTTHSAQVVCRVHTYRTSHARHILDLRARL